MLAAASADVLKPNPRQNATLCHRPVRCGGVGRVEVVAGVVVGLGAACGGVGGFCATCTDAGAVAGACVACVNGVCATGACATGAGGCAIASSMRDHVVE